MPGLLAAMIVIACLLHLLISPKYIFRVSFREGELCGVKGTILRSLKHALSEVAKRQAVTGEIMLQSPRQLSFSHSVGEIAKQRFRNVFFAQNRPATRT